MNDDSATKIIVKILTIFSSILLHLVSEELRYEFSGFDA
jgi:hypothetical protein